MRPVRREIIDGIHVTRVALFPSHDRSTLRRILTYLSFALSGTVFGLPALGRFDVTYVYQPPATAAVPAIALRVFRGTPYVLDVQDLWPDTVATTGMLTNPIWMRCLAWGCRLTYSMAARISVLSPGFKKQLGDRGIPPERIEVIYNWSEEEAQFSSPQWVPDGWPQDKALFTVLFAGTMGTAQGVQTILEAARLLHERRPSVRIVMMGGGIELSRVKTAALALPNVLVLQWQPRDLTARCLRAADALLVHLVDQPLFRITIPSKTQAYLAAGRPIVAGVAGDAADLVMQAGAGVLCTPGDAESMALAIQHLVDLPSAQREAMGARGRDYYMHRLSRERGVSSTVRLLESAARA
jgi:glycosyltransferase involved in cell wall biosynthesis